MSDYEYQKLKQHGFHAEAEEYRRLMGLTRPSARKPAAPAKRMPKSLEPHPVTIMHALAAERSIKTSGVKMELLVQRLAGMKGKPSKAEAKRWLELEAKKRPELFEIVGGKVKAVNRAHEKRKTEKKQKKKKSKRDKFSEARKARQGFYASREWREVRYKAIEKHGNACQCCGATASPGNPIHVDHIKPRSKHPELELDVNNLQILCALCNLGKSNKFETDWR